MNRRRLISAVTATPLLAGIGLAGVAFAATHRAQHLVITEVGIDTTFDPPSSPTSEYVEIHNPTALPIVLNDSVGAYYLSDGGTAGNEYWRVVNGPVAIGSDDYLFKFPVGTVIPAHGTIVVCNDSRIFLDEFFGNADGIYTETAARFYAQPGSPQLFEYVQDGVLDGVPDVVDMDTGGATRMSITNTQEFAMLFWWDGKSDLVADVDLVAWGSTSPTPRKTTATVIDGPDAGTATSAYKDDVTLVSALAAAVISRRSAVEKNETDAGGNGLVGSDELSEAFTVAATDPWTSGAVASATPGVQRFSLDSLGGDALSWLRPAAVSLADGPNGTASPLDWGADGTLTEMYVTSLDADRNGTNEAVYVAIRGDMFGEPDTNESNVELLLVDVNPYVSTGGVRRLIAAGSDLNDTDRTIDAVITGASVQMGPSVPLTADWDAAIAFDKLPDLATNQDVLTWNALALGSPTAFVSVPTLARPKFDGNVDAAIFPAAAGTSHAGGDLYEAIIPTALGTLAVTHLGLTAVTTAGDGANASPNTLPEGAYDSTTSATVPIERFLCWDVAASKAVVYYADTDNDGHGNASAPSAYCGPSTAGVAAVGDDCNDGNDKVFPGAVEICNSIDDDCDALVDAADSDTVLTTFFADVDNDTFGNPMSTTKACSAPGGFIADSTDCNDANALIKPTGIEICNAIDDDCDTVADDGIPTQTWYLDSDNDLFGGSTSAVACAAPVGYIAANGDCLDTDPLVNPNATEVCNLKDDDCDLTVDDGVQTTYYRDVDGDTFGAKLVTQAACSVAPVGYVADKTDCDDNAFAVKPSAIEVCNTIDDDCDTFTDDLDSSVTGRGTYFADTDGDTFGDPLVSVTVCFPTLAQVANSTDCNDTSAAIKPTATEVCNAIDDDCDNLVDDADVFTGGALYSVDFDNDGFGDDSVPPAHKCAAPLGTVDNDADCDDLDKDVNPVATEICNAIDDDCDVGVDDLDPEGAVGTFWYPDFDNDSHGDDTATGLEQCDAPGVDYADVGDDCDDTVKEINPEKTEVCNSLDDDCDGKVDAADPSVFGATTWFVDVDKDGFGDVNDQGAAYCSDPIGHALTATDCKDNDKTVYPGAAEVADQKDNDCDGHDETYDADGDGLDVLEEAANNTNPEVADTDDDGLEDGDEVLEGTNPLVQDTDEDGVFDGAEVLNGTEPLVKDTDDDGLDDGAEADAGSDPLVKDTDEDGIEDGDEVADGTDPTLADTDVDGVDDGLEARDGTDPLDKTDFHDDAYDGDSDGLPDHTEYTLGTDETKADTDGGGVNDGDEVDAGTDPLDGSDDPVPDTDSGLDTDTDTGDTGVLPPEKKCGCESGTSAPLWAFGVALFGLRRRRTAR